LIKKVTKKSSEKSPSALPAIFVSGTAETKMSVPANAGPVFSQPRAPVTQTINASLPDRKPLPGEIRQNVKACAEGKGISLALKRWSEGAKRGRQGLALRF